MSLPFLSESRGAVRFARRVVRPACGLALGAIVLFAVPGLRAQEPLGAVLQRAREAVGPEMALEAVNSIRFAGVVKLEDGRQWEIEIIVKKPMQQRVSIIMSDRRQVTALSDYEGWQRIESLKSQDDWQLSLLDAPQIQRLRANTVENLAFFTGVTAAGGTVEYLGEAGIDGTPCDKVRFSHPGGIRFTRYFDKQNGRLLFSETEGGGTIREVGEMVVRGVRFPRQILTESSEGKSTLVFAEIEVNREFPDSFFDMPMYPWAGAVEKPAPASTQADPAPGEPRPEAAPGDSRPTSASDESRPAGGE